MTFLIHKPSFGVMEGLRNRLINYLNNMGCLATIKNKSQSTLRFLEIYSKCSCFQAQGILFVTANDHISDHSSYIIPWTYTCLVGAIISYTHCRYKQLEQFLSGMTGQSFAIFKSHLFNVGIRYITKFEVFNLRLKFKLNIF